MPILWSNQESNSPSSLRLDVFFFFFASLCISIFQAGNQGLWCFGNPPCGVGMSRYLTASKEQQQEASWTGHVMRDKNDRSCYGHVPISRLLVASSSSEFVQGASQSFLHPSRACHRLDARLRKALWMCFPILSPMPWQIKVRLAREPGNNGHAVHGKKRCKKRSTNRLARGEAVGRQKISILELSCAFL